MRPRTVTLARAGGADRREVLNSLRRAAGAVGALSVKGDLVSPPTPSSSRARASSRSPPTSGRLPYAPASAAIPTRSSRRGASPSSLGPPEDRHHEGHLPPSRMTSSAPTSPPASRWTRGRLRHPGLRCRARGEGGGRLLRRDGVAGAARARAARGSRFQLRVQRPVGKNAPGTAAGSALPAEWGVISSPATPPSLTWPGSAAGPRCIPGAPPRSTRTAATG